MLKLAPSFFLKLSCGLALTLAALMSAQAAGLKENFNAAFPAWESGWFAANSNARNDCAVNYCLVGGEWVPPGHDVRGNAGDGMWLDSQDGMPSSPITITFLPAFGARLKEFKIDVAVYVPSTLEAWDMDGRLLLSRQLKVDDYRDIPTRQYQSVHIRSSNGIARFSLSGPANGNTAVDNIRAVVSN